MAPLDPADVQAYVRSSGTFTSVRKLVKPGESVEVKLLDISKCFKTTYPIKDKDYTMRVTLEHQGQQLLLDCNGATLIGAFTAALYAHGPTAPPTPCRVRLTRRTERSKSQSELSVEVLKE